MQRLKVLGGRLSADQWRALADIAETYTPDTPLHLTTRQDIEFHDVPAAKVPAVQRALAEAGLSTLGACGDTLRNITVCPCSGVRDGSPDLLPLGRAIRRRLEAMGGIHELPMKFKIALSCGASCGRPYINDLGLYAAERDGQTGLAAVVAGSLGARPATGITFRAWLAPEDAVHLAEAAVRMFARRGDRTNRRKARLRHVRERMIEGPFLAELTETFEQVRRDAPQPEIYVPTTETGLREEVRLHFPNGDVSPASAEALAQLADEAAVVSIACDHSVVVYGLSREELVRQVHSHHALHGAQGGRATVVACPGSRWCRRALVDTRTAAEDVRAAIAGIPAEGTTVCISGCPNGCAHTAVADVGLSGRRAGGGPERVEAFDLYAGGGMGREPRLAQRIAQAVSAGEVADKVATLLDDRPDS